MIDHDGKLYGWSFITFLNLGTAAAVWKFFDLLATFPNPRVLALMLVATVVIDLFSTISIYRRCLLPSPDEPDDEYLIELEKRMIAHDLSRAGMI